MTTPPSYPSTKDFKIPEYLKRDDLAVKAISLSQRNLIIRYNVSADMKGEIKILITGKWEADVQQLKNKAVKKGFAAENIDLLVKGFGHIYSGEAADTIAQIKDWARREAEAEKVAQAAGAQDGKKKPKVFKYYIQKYHDLAGGNELYEAVLIGSNKAAYFASIDREQSSELVVRCRLSHGFTISNAMTNTVVEILPREDLSYLSKPYEFESEKELNEYLQEASSLSLDDMFEKVKGQGKKYVDGSNTHITLAAADCVFTYFQDIFGQTHYLFFYGDNSSGKTINLQLLSLLVYRMMYDIDITPANIYTYFGTIEEGQGTIGEDEADGLDYKQQEKMKIYKKGYNSGGKVTRQDEVKDGQRNPQGYYVYGFKAFTGEKRLDPDYAKGFNERTFYQECEEGDPPHDLSEVVSPGGDEELETLKQVLQHLHKLLFAFRLIHHTDHFPNIDVGVRNREKQLVKPLLRLFQNTKSLPEITKALGDKIAERRGIKKNTLEYAVYQVVNELIEAQKDVQTRFPMGNPPDSYEFAAKEIYAKLCERLDGEYKNDKDQAFDTPEHGMVSHKKINSICEDRFGAKKRPDRNKGNMLKFATVRFDKVKKVYELSDKGIQITVKEVEKKDRESDKDSIEVPQVQQGTDHSFEEKIKDADDENRSETEQDVEYSQQTDRETEESEEQEEKENV